MAEVDVLVAGDAAITFAWQLSAPPIPGRTSKLLGTVEPEGRFGGCAPSVALALTGFGHRVALVSWLGDDAYGRAYLTKLRSHGIDTAGVAVAAGQATQATLVLTDGPAGCRVIEPGGVTAIPAAAIEVQDPTGVGDVFFAAFLSATMRGRAPRDAATFATGEAAGYLLNREKSA